MYNWIRKYSFIIYLNFSLSLLKGITPFNWEWWIIIIPTIFLIVWSYGSYKEL